MPAANEGNPNISRPRPLMKRHKSMAGGLQSDGTSVASRRSSAISGSNRLSHSGGTSMIQQILKALNTPISDRNLRPEVQSISSGSIRSSLFSRSRRSEGRQTSLRVPGPRSTSSLRNTATSLISTYSAFRESIVDTSDSCLTTEEVIKLAKDYYTTVKIYLDLLNDLPSSVRDTLEVARLRQQLEFTIELLRPGVDDAPSGQTTVLLDQTVLLAKQILTDAENLLHQQQKLHVSVAECKDHEEGSSSHESENEHDMPNAYLANLIGYAETENEIDTKSFRRTRSATNLLEGFIRKDPLESARNSFPSVKNATGQSRRDSEDDLQQPQETLVDVSTNIEAALAAFKESALFSEICAPEVSIDKPVDTVDITYGRDGSPIAMSPAAIIEQLAKELCSEPTRIVSPSGDLSDIIFTTFRLFWKPMKFLHLLEQAYDYSYPYDNKLGIVMIAQTWVLTYWSPQDSQAEGLINAMQCFLVKPLRDRLVSGNIIINILSRLEYYAANPTHSAIAHEESEIELESMKKRFMDQYQSIRILGFNQRRYCQELAYQLTLKESALYLQLSPMELVGYFVKGKKDEAEAGEKLNQLREFSCNVKRWATWNVLRRPNPFERAKMFGFMMRLAKACLKIRNFSSAHSIYNGALSIHLDMLGQTNAELTPKARNNMQYIETFFKENPDISMQSSAKPTIPIMALYAGKLTRLSETKGLKIRSKIDSSIKLIDISFLRAARRVIYAMESNQRPYKPMESLTSQEFIDHTLSIVPSEDEIDVLYANVKSEERKGTPRPGLLKRLRSDSIVTFPASY